MSASSARSVPQFTPFTVHKAHCRRPVQNPSTSRLAAPAGAPLSLRSLRQSEHAPPSRRAAAGHCSAAALVGRRSGGTASTAAARRRPTGTVAPPDRRPTARGRPGPRLSGADSGRKRGREPRRAGAGSLPDALTLHYNTLNTTTTEAYIFNFRSIATPVLSGDPRQASSVRPAFHSPSGKNQAAPLQAPGAHDSRLFLDRPQKYRQLADGEYAITWR